MFTKLDLSDLIDTEEQKTKNIKLSLLPRTHTHTHSHTHTQTNISKVVRTQVCAHTLLNVEIFARTFFKWMELGKY